MVNSLEDNILADYDPYQTANGSGDIAKATVRKAGVAVAGISRPGGKHDQTH